ncbi:thioesterase family protein [Mycobacterium sp. CBMA293]|uniref:thioesterase family protein n=1 Tax=unclassified Mycolicibacterium TaxID=2636767 RepID=UPI0012DF2FFD|nr:MULTISPECIES: thioesterase family protein [unclassified Mycolicibacterium]MUL47966.1 thioesterase family protein [Mycolicibacterium sp. CBMA 360]MUL58144.1 thioesterase family protein [Mycolicibacterium sp. CBMA 335]MUL73602.1 thioesterase family protein [Mycolicibacterium sp. CBMA 311]MUL93027.1 thioesterase family protein [Mycolicibacterium sp. CBMA 230]MUM07576.1 diacylglycerol kinase [Mycolicibacterium sp. CBMA 213]
MTPHPFTDLTTITAFDAGTYTATIDPVWTIGPKVHGGCMMAVCAAAAQRCLPDAAELAPIALSANYLNAPDPGEVVLTTTVRKRGRQVNLVQVELSQHGRAAVTCSVTLGPVDAKPPRHQVPLAASAMAVEPPADAVRVTPEHPMGQIVHVAQGCDLRMDGATPFLTGTEGEPVTRMWLRPFASDEADSNVALLFALMAGDITPPVTMNLGHFGWTPTVQLTTYLRHRPAPGWLRVMASSTVIGNSWFEEDHLILDANGEVVVQSRQLAMLPLGS